MGDAATSIVTNTRNGAMSFSSTKSAAMAAAAAASVSFYAVPADGPASDLVSEWPAFKLELSVWKNDTLIDRRTFRVNRWGGTQMIGLRYE